MADPEPSRDAVDTLPGPTVVEFGASWCGFCLALAPDVDRLLKEHPQVRHVRVEDGPGKPLGRSFKVKLWPTLVFMRDGEVRARLVRPQPSEVKAAMDALVAGT